MRSSIKYTAAITLLLIMTGCIKEDGIPPKDSNYSSLRNLIANNFSFSLWYEAMQQAGVDTILDNSSNGYTLFVPDNNAFAKSGISRDSLRRISAAELKKMVQYHIMTGTTISAGIPQALNYGYTALNSQLLYTSTNQVDTALYINGVAVLQKDIMAKNGVIHALGQVLTPPPPTVQDLLTADPNYSCLVAGFRKFGIWDELRKPGPMVVLAPTNDAFAAHNLDEAAIEAMNPAEYRKAAFSAYLMDPVFFFIPNVFMAPPAGPFIQGDIYLLLERGSNGSDLRVKAVPWNYRSVEMQNRSIFYGDWVNFPFTSPGKLAANGIVHQAMDLYMIPDSVRIK
ncbi:MAG TPA: fasciclin domain-containing protein [Pseudobacter sp.]|jgi:uncharacterized surface protein with fasciclin (FAS1) repeats|nr:fasciclin domain-containing protein [Pseudobacter sp.]